ncbi:MAG: hypothetical protein ROY99_13940 [Ignavibacterium sp.]|jgi:hypothetical protein|nr:hypothetical protein [Ignavibacterium sp.]
MELIPILSTIILVATICTFILAVGAYILYKIREGKQQYAFQTKPSTVKAELVIPSEAAIGKVSIQPEQRRTLPVEPGITREEYTKQQQPAQSKFTPEPKEYKAEESKVEKQKVRMRVNSGRSDENKFLKYTSEGYIPTQEDRSSGELKWR